MTQKALQITLSITNSMSVNCLCIPANAVLKFDKGNQYTQVSFDQQSRPSHAVVSVYPGHYIIAVCSVDHFS